MRHKRRNHVKQKGSRHDDQHPITTNFRGNHHSEPRMTLDQEARNTEHHSFSKLENRQLRYSGVQFVSGGGLKPDDSVKTNDLEDSEPQKTSRSDLDPQTHVDHHQTDEPECQSVPDNTRHMTQAHDAALKQNSEPSINTIENNLFFVDLDGDSTVKKTNLPNPVIRCDSPAETDSSDDEVVFKGRRQLTSRPKVITSDVSIFSQMDLRPDQPTGARSCDDSASPNISRGSPKIEDSNVPSPAKCESTANHAAVLDCFAKPPWPNKHRAPTKRRKGLRGKYSRNNDPDVEAIADYIKHMDYDSSSGIESQEERLIREEINGDSKMKDLKHGNFSHGSKDTGSVDDADATSNFEMETGKPSTPHSQIHDDNHVNSDHDLEMEQNPPTIPNKKISIQVSEVEESVSGWQDCEIKSGCSSTDDDIEDLSDSLEQQWVTDEQMADFLKPQHTFEPDIINSFIASELEGQARANRNKHRQGKARGNRSQGRKTPFLSATALADMLDEEHPYGDFDIMDFDRPSLKRKSKGGRRTPMFDLSDSELEQHLQSVYEVDRQKKKTKRKQREELRSQGLLTGKSGKVDMKAKYSNGMSVVEIKSEMRTFLLATTQTLALPPMAKKDRKLVHDMANSLSLKSLSRGSGSNRFPVLTKTARTPTFNSQDSGSVDALFSKGRVMRRLEKGTAPPRGKRAVQKFRGGAGEASYGDGEVVGASAPEIGIENRGRAMLEKMGWNTGTALGAQNNKGILHPVVHVVKTSKAGLG